MESPQRVKLVTSTPSAWAAHLAAVWCLLFGCAHVYWALGGTAGFVAATGSAELLTQTWFVVIGLWGVGMVCLIGVLVCQATVRPWGRRVPAWLLRTVLWLGVAVLALRALPTGVQDLLLVSGVLRPSQSMDWAVVDWRLALWTPWFIIAVVLFAMTAVNYGRRLRRSASIAR